MEIGLNIGQEQLIRSVIDYYYGDLEGELRRPREHLSSNVYRWATSSGAVKITYAFQPLNPRELKFIIDTYFYFVPDSIILYNQLMSIIPTGDTVDVSGFFENRAWFSVTLGYLLDPFVFMLTKKIQVDMTLDETICSIEQFLT